MTGCIGRKMIILTYIETSQIPSIIVSPNINIVFVLVVDINNSFKHARMSHYVKLDQDIFFRSEIFAKCNHVRPVFPTMVRSPRGIINPPLAHRDRHRSTTSIGFAV